ncbi:MAG TPA: LacI family DNA-binding transcriptional regulator [Bacillota bacterium]|jgi:LacI family transcriptional regulator|nr:LacI family transcriptional regulator [Bacillota bacterium]HOB43435.1 LacI family DNA-binding transcriptional regulator [Bacillota bacterium]HOK70138.1 LacI family DNA-binding transcriptional regulator [Bacillota bacterium]HOO31012.1 LacI family DNA-binding transcriptional regulator [Bacillota bacterium]HPQ02268.1 LacI family DNA-binding transcriptional regulator [Bacillota bacterium]
MGVTIEDVARRAGVSASTVSRTLNNKGRISAETRRRVIEAARELEYPVSADAGLSRRRTNRIGILFDRRLHSLVADPFYGLVMVGVEEWLRDEGYQVFFSTFSDREADMAMISEFAAERPVDGLIMAGCDIDLDCIRKAVFMGMPLVLVDNNIVEPKVPCVMTDNTAGAREAVEHLISLGHEEIGFVSGPMTHSSLYERYQGYRQAMEANGLLVRSDMVIAYEDVADYDVNGGYKAAERLLKRSPRPTAIFAGNDSMAIGVMKAAQELGLVVPDDLSVVGFDDIELAAHTTPALTTVRVHKRELGYHAARLLLESIDGDPDRIPYKIAVCTELIVRESTCPRRLDA